MKVLMLGWELPPHNSGGLGVACYQLCQAMARDDVDIEFIVPYQEKHDAPFMTITAAHPQGAPVILANGSAYDSYKYTYDDGHEERLDIYGQQHIFEHSVAKLVVSKEYDVIHAHDWLTFRAGLRAKQAHNVPLILHVHSIERDRAGGEPGNPLVRQIEETSMLLADRVVAVSELTKQAIIADYAIPADKIEVIHNSLDHERITKLQANENVNAYRYLSQLKLDGYHVVCSVGRLTVMKGLPNLLRAAAEVIARLPKTVFLISGSGEQYFELIALAADLGIARNVIFTGFQRGHYWRDSYAIGDLFVLPSVTEPFGITPLEAIGFGVPTLISKQSGVSEVLKNTLKVDCWDVHGMANQIVGALSSEALRSELIKNAQHEVAAFSWNHAADKIFDVYSHELKEMAV